MLAAVCLALASTVGLSESIPMMAVPEEPTPLRSVHIRAAGDLMMHAKQLDIAWQPGGAYDFHPQYGLVESALAAADYTIANLETTVGRCRDMAYSGYPLFNAPESLLEAVRDAGVDFLTLANNHMLDRYFEGVVSTVDLVERHGFDHGGAYRTQEERDTPVIVEVNGVKIGMYCCTQSTNGMERWCDREARAYCVNYLRGDAIEDGIGALKAAGAEVVIALPHWGEEYRRRPEAGTVALAKKLIAAGADVVLGSHPHMVQPVEYVSVTLEDGTERTGLVAYSLGNFISNMPRQYTDSGIILDFTLREKQEGGFEAVDVGVVPIFVWRRSYMIQAMPSLKYFDNRPESMEKYRFERMRQSCREIRMLLDESIRLLPE